MSSFSSLMNDNKVDLVRLAAKLLIRGTITAIFGNLLLLLLLLLLFSFSHCV